MLFEMQKILVSLGMPTTILLTHIIVLENLQGELEQLFQWFSGSQLVANARKCHLLTSSKITIQLTLVLANPEGTEQFSSL